MTKYTKKPINELVADAQTGDQEAQKALGLLHEIGLAPQASSKEALKWLEEAAKNGDGFSALSAAELLESGGNDLKPDSQKAQEYFKLAASLGFERSEYRLPKPDSLLTGSPVLFVDRINQQLSQMEKVLISQGFKADCIEHIDHLKERLSFYKDYRCFFVDVEITKPDHTCFLRTIRKFSDYKDTPIVIVTAITDIAVIKEAKKFGISGWILKPVQGDLVLATAQKLVN